MSTPPAWLTDLLYDREFAGRMLSEKQIWAVATVVWTEFKERLLAAPMYSSNAGAVQYVHEVLDALGDPE